MLRYHVPSIPSLSSYSFNHTPLNAYKHYLISIRYVFPMVSPNKFYLHLQGVHTDKVLTLFVTFCLYCLYFTIILRVFDLLNFFQASYFLHQIAIVAQIVSVVSFFWFFFPCTTNYCIKYNLQWSAASADIVSQFWCF